jgi:hypothetical protein
MFNISKLPEYQLVPSESITAGAQDEIYPSHLVIEKADGSQLVLDAFLKKTPSTVKQSAIASKDIQVVYDGKVLGKVLEEHAISPEKKAQTVFASILILNKIVLPPTDLELAMQRMTEDGLFSNMRADRRETLFKDLLAAESKGFPFLKGVDPARIYAMINTGYIETAEGLKKHLSWMEIFPPDKQDWKAFLDLVLLGLLKGALTETSVATVFTYWTLFTFHNDLADKFEEIDAFTETGEVNQKAKKMIAKTLGNRASEEKMQAFFKEIKTLARSEQRFISAPLFLTQDGDIEDKMRALSENIEEFRSLASEDFVQEKIIDLYKLAMQRNILSAIYETTVNFLGVCGNSRIFAPMGMKQACLNTFTDYPVRLRPRFGAAHMQKASSVGTRDQSLRSPYQPVPVSAEDFRAPGASYLEHDMYHAVVQSCIPVEIQTLFIRLAKLADEIPNKDSIVEGLQFRLFDIDAVLYFSKTQASKLSQLFWFQMSVLIIGNRNDLMAQKTRVGIRELKQDPVMGMTPVEKLYFQKMMKEIAKVPQLMDDLEAVRAPEFDYMYDEGYGFFQFPLRPLDSLQILYDQMR